MFLEIRYFPEKPCQALPSSLSHWCRGRATRQGTWGDSQLPLSSHFLDRRQVPGPGGLRDGPVAAQPQLAASGGLRAGPGLHEERLTVKGTLDAPSAPHTVLCPEVAFIRSRAVT